MRTFAKRFDDDRHHPEQPDKKLGFPRPYPRRWVDGSGSRQGTCHLINNSGAGNNFFWERWKGQGRGQRSSERKGRKERDGKGNGKEKSESERAPRICLPKVVAAPRAPRGPGAPGKGLHCPGSGRPSLPGAAGARVAGLACPRAAPPRAFPPQCLLRAAAGPASGSLRAAGIACAGWEWRSPRWRRAGGRHASGCGVGERGSACARPGTPGSAGPFRRFPPDSRASDGGAERRAASPGAPCTRRAPLRPSAAWHLADAPWRGGGGPAVWEPRGPPPPAPRPAPARCLRPRPSRPAPSPARRSRSPARR